MIDKVKIRNFKSFSDFEINLKGLNLLMGLNGMGKSTLIQALLLLRQNRGSRLQSLNLNGDLVRIGRGVDALYNYAEEETIGFKILFSGADGAPASRLEVDYAYTRESDVLELGNADIPPAVFSQPLFTDEFIFLNAERVSPAVAYNTSYERVTGHNEIGTHGEWAVHFLNVNENLTVAPGLRHPGAKSASLFDQVVAWMDVISPGVNIEIHEIQEIDKIVISYRYSTGSVITGNALRPTNVGFGITYVLPILVACLSGQFKLLIIENPEAHIHPKGQARIGELLARCAAGGAQLIVETHSDHIVNGLRVAVKEKRVPAGKVQIDYFSKKVVPGVESHTENEPISIGLNGELSSYPPDFLDEWSNQLMALI